MLCLPRAETVNQVLTQPIATDQLGLADLLEISDLLIRRQTFRFRVASWSMYPMLRKGDRLPVEPVSATSLHVGIPEGRRWFRYHRIGGRGIPERLKGQQRFHLVAKLARISVGSLNIEAGPEGSRVTAFYVRIPYRGLGVASQLLAFACHLASR